MKFALCRSDIDACDLRLEGVETVWEVPKDKLCLSGGRGLTLESIETYGTVPSESTPFYGKDTVQTTNKIPILSTQRDPRVILAAKAEVVSFLKLVARLVKFGRHSGLKIRRR